MRTVCQQTGLMKYHTLFFSKIRKDVAKYVICCSRDWRFQGKPLSGVQEIWCFWRYKQKERKKMRHQSKLHH